MIPVELSGFDWKEEIVPLFTPASDELELDDLVRALPVLNSSPEVLSDSRRRMSVVSSCTPETLCIL